MKPSTVWPVIITLSALVLGWLTWLDVESTIRPFLAFWYLLVCPGMAYVQLLHLKSPISRWMLAIALSIAINTLVSEILVLSNLWSANWGLTIVIAISLFGLCLQLYQAWWHRAEGNLWSSLKQVKEATEDDEQIGAFSPAYSQAALDETQQSLYLDLIDRLKSRIAQIEAISTLNRQQYDEVLAHQKAIDHLYSQLLANLNSIEMQRQIQAERAAVFQTHIQWRIDFARAVENHNDHAFALYCYQMAEDGIGNMFEG